LARWFFAIDDEAITIGNPEFDGELASDPVQMSQKLAVAFGDIGVSRDNSSWNDEDVRGRLGIDVAKRQAAIVLENNVRGDLAVDNFLKDIVLHHGELWFQ
jgi:hypothetical protein